MTPDFDTWLTTGLNNRWITAPTCMMHDSVPTTPEEAQQLEAGDDPCIPILRLVHPHDIEAFETQHPDLFRR